MWPAFKHTFIIQVRLQCPNTELHFHPDAQIDPQETQTLLDFLAECIEVKVKNHSLV